MKSLRIFTPGHCAALAAALVFISAGFADAQTTVRNGAVYRLFNMNSQKILTNPGSSTANGTQMVQGVPAGSTSALATDQCWKAEASGSNWRFKNISSGKYLEVSGSQLTTNNAPVQQWASSTGTNQIWTLIADADGSFQVKNVGSGQVMQMPNASTASGALVTQWPYSDVTHKRWAFEEVAAGGNKARVYIGGSGKVWEFTAASNWTYVKQNVDGMYVTAFAFTNPREVTNPDTNAKVAAWKSALTNDNAFFETDKGLNQFDWSDSVAIDIMRNQGMKVTYTTINDNNGTLNGQPFDQNRLDTLRFHNGWRPVLGMVGPWNWGGDITTSPGAMSHLVNTDGLATDGPSTFALNNYGSFKEGNVSCVRYTRDHGGLTMLMIATADIGSDTNTPTQNGALYLTATQTLVHYCEDNGGSPDVWAMSYYGSRTVAISPESNANGTAAGTITGATYWLIKHLKGISGFAKLDLVPQKGIQIAEAKAPRDAAEKVIANAPSTTKETHFDLPLALTGKEAGRPITKTVTYRLSNNSTWMDICPVLFGSLEDPTKSWTAKFEIEGRDVTGALADGLVFNNKLRLWPQQDRLIKVTLTSKTAIPGPVDVKLSFTPHPTNLVEVCQRLVLSVTPTGDRVASAK